MLRKPIMMPQSFWNRRRFLSGSLSLASAPLMFPGRATAESADQGKAPHILLRPGTHQRGNIGDIAHTPGALRLFEQHFPEARFSVWPVGISEESRAGLLRMFPEVRIVEGTLDEKGRPDSPELAEAWQSADLLLHGSAPGFKGRGYMRAWREASDKPYGIFGLTHDPLSGVNGAYPRGATLAGFRDAITNLPPDQMARANRTLLDGASFLFCRDSLTRLYYEGQNIQCPRIAFGPDTTFALRIRDDERADAYLEKHGLEQDRFLCAIPRLRYTPYHLFPSWEREPTPGDLLKDTINEETREKDHAKLRELIVRWVRETGLKVLACPEMSYQVELSKRMLVDPLPDDVKSHVVWRDQYWQPDEAASIYARAIAVASFECHSPIIALTNGTPAMYLRQPTDTIKGQMYHDIGVSDWTFEIDESEAADWLAPLLAIHADPGAARARVSEVMAGIADIQKGMVKTVEQRLDDSAV